MFDAAAYLEAEKTLREVYDDMVKNGELTEEEADFRFMMARDDMLETMPD